MNNDSPRKFFDVAHPGQSAANATSRPVIASKSPITQDPMFHEGLPADQKPRVPAPPAPMPPNNPELQPATAPVTPDPSTLDPQALLIQAGTFTPPKASKGTAYKATIIILCVFMMVMAVGSYLLVNSL